MGFFLGWLVLLWGDDMDTRATVVDVAETKRRGELQR